MTDQNIIELVAAWSRPFVQGQGTTVTLRLTAVSSRNVFPCVTRLQARQIAIDPEQGRDCRGGLSFSLVPACAGTIMVTVVAERSDAKGNTQTYDGQFELEVAEGTGGPNPVSFFIHNQGNASAAANARPIIAPVQSDTGNLAVNIGQLNVASHQKSAEQAAVPLAHPPVEKKVILRLRTEAKQRKRRIVAGLIVCGTLGTSVAVNLRGPSTWVIQDNELSINSRHVEKEQPPARPRQVEPPHIPGFSWALIEAGDAATSFFAASTCLTLAVLETWSNEPKIKDLYEMVLSEHGQPGLAPDQPILCLSEVDIGALCSALMESGKIRVPAGQELRLMSETEWKVAHDLFSHDGGVALADLSSAGWERCSLNWKARQMPNATCILRSADGVRIVSSIEGLDEHSRGRCRLVIAPQQHRP